jgi:NADH:ubiquinone oxidoreductase subunit 4 (subunit M)
MLQRTLFGQSNNDIKYSDLSIREIVMLLPLLILLLATGIVPSFFMQLYETQLYTTLQEFMLVIGGVK